MSDLPQKRVVPEPRFTNCSVDMFGSFVVKEGRKEIKKTVVCLHALVAEQCTRIKWMLKGLIQAFCRFILRHLFRSQVAYSY